MKEILSRDNRCYRLGLNRARIALLLLLLLGWSSLFAQDQSEILNKIAEMQKQIQQQQQQLLELQQRLTEQQQNTVQIVQQEVKTAVADSASASASDQPLLSLGKGIEGLSLKGDMRLRYEYINTDFEEDDDRRSKSRFRHRVRLGGLWKNPTEDWEIGLGLEFGSGDGTSANDSWNKSSVWESGDVYLDYAYARHRLGDSGLSLTVGQQKNPWQCSMLTFDGDLRPTGATLGYQKDNIFATLGAYNIRSDAKINGDSQSLANMYGGQVGFTWENDSLHALLALGFFYYDSNTGEYMLEAEDYKYQIGTAYAEMGSKIGAVDVKGFAELAVNFAADNDFSQATYSAVSKNPPVDYDAEDNDLGWTLGLEAKYGKFKAKYAYAYIGGESVPYFMSDSDFGSALQSKGSTNVQGHVLGLSYALSKNCSLGGTVMLTDYIEAPEDHDDNGLLYQIDLSYKF